MTRLTKELIEDIPESLNSYDICLTSNTGYNLKEIACTAAGLKSGIPDYALTYKIGIVPITSGLGVISGFTDSVNSIVSHLGFSSFITEATNVHGISQAYDAGADIIFMADDNKFMGLNTHTNKYSENNYCTALGYVVALEKMADGFRGKNILVLGYGPVGKIASELITQRHGNVWIYDKKDLSSNSLDSQIKILKDKNQIKDFEYIFDATNEGGWINFSDMNTIAKIAAPGVPLSFIGNVNEGNSIHLVHDRLPIGVATMLITVL